MTYVIKDKYWVYVSDHSGVFAQKHFKSLTGAYHWLNEYYPQAKGE